MKELFSGIWALIWALVVTSLMWSIGTLYSLGYSVWLSISFKKPLAFFKFWWRLIDGFLAAIGHVLFEVAYALDLTWNVNGEILEDFITHKEDTTFSKKNITVSSSTGRLELDGNLNKLGKRFSKLLNFFFGQKRHAIDSWNYMVAKEKLKNEFFE